MHLTAGGMIWKSAITGAHFTSGVLDDDASGALFRNAARQSRATRRSPKNNAG